MSETDRIFSEVGDRISARVGVLLAAERAAGRLAGLREAAEVARKVSDWQAQGWRENPKTEGCGGAIAAANTGMLTVQDIFALAEGKEG